MALSKKKLKREGSVDSGVKGWAERLVETKIEVILHFGGREDEGQVAGVHDDGSEEHVPLAQIRHS